MALSRKNPSIDFCKGLALIFSAFQNMRFLLVSRFEPSEVWNWPFPNQPNTALFIMRIFCHIGVTAFFFFVGMNVVLFWRRRVAEIGPRAAYFALVKRALLLLLSDIALSPLFRPFYEQIEPIHGFMFFTTTLTTISVALLVLPAIVDFGNLLLYGGLVAILLTQGLMEAIAAHPDFAPIANSWPMALFFTGEGVDWFRMSFPLIGWIGISCIGAWIGNLYLSDRKKYLRALWVLGLLCLFAFIIIRITGGWGNTRHDLPLNGPLDWFKLIKHPPSLAYITFTLSVTLLFLYWCEMKLSYRKWLLPFLVIGRNGLFFYVSHFYLFWIFAKLFFPQGTDSEIIRFTILIGGTAVLYAACTIKEKIQRKQVAYI